MIGTKFSTEKTLWEKYGKWVIVSLISFAIAYGATEYYKYTQNQKVVKASLIYDKILLEMKKRDYETVKADAETIKQQYSKTPYAALSALLVAKINLEENKLDAAADSFKQAMQYGEKGAVYEIAKIRLARVLAAQEKYIEALAVLTKQAIPEAYITLVEETKGDIYAMQKQLDKAREAYQTAQKMAPPGIPLARLQLKQAELGTKPAELGKAEINNKQTESANKTATGSKQ